ILALPRWQARKRLFDSLSEIGLAAAESFDSILASMTKTHLILDTWEIWLMYEKDFDVFLLDSIEQSARGYLSDLIDQAYGEEEAIRQYTGFPWNPPTR